jgi:deoxyribose-phosphate aldolase
MVFMKLLRFPADEDVIRGVVSKAELASLLVTFPQDEFVKKVCNDAVSFGMAGVLATPFLCPTVSSILKGSGVDTICINSLFFIHDENLDCKKLTVEEILRLGVKDFDMMPSLGMVRDSEYEKIEREFSVLTDIMHKAGGRLGLILETEFMSEEEQIRLGQAAVNSGADYLRICGGMELVCHVNGGRANLRNICRVKDQVSGKIKIKAGGGWELAYLEDAHEYIQSGADRVDAGPNFIGQLIDIGYRR